MESITIDPRTFVRTRLPKIERAQQALKIPFSATRERNNRSLYHFIQYFWPIVNNKEFKPNWHIDKVLCPELETVAYRVADDLPKLYDLIFNVPPGTTKTMACSVMFPVWCWTKWFWMSFITGSYSSDLSLEKAELSRDLVRSDQFKAIYPELSIKQDKDAKGNFKVVKKEQAFPGREPRIIQGGSRYSTSVKATATGFHGHIIIIDDPLNPEQAVSEVELATANRFMGQTLSTRKVEKSVTPTILIMQRLHQDDPSGHILEKKNKRIRHISLPGEIRNYREQVKPREWIKYYKDDLLDPGRMNWEVLKEMEADLGQYGFAGQVGQEPTPPGGGMFKVDHFQIITMLPSPVNFIQTIRYWDKAASGGKGAFTVGVKMSKLTSKLGYDWFIVEDVKRGQWATEEREAIIRETANADGDTVQIFVEQEPGSGGKDSADGTVRNLAGFSCLPDSPTGDKTFRADTYSVQVNNGNVRLLKGDWNHEYVEEFRYFPFSTYKDQVDASSGAFKKLTGKRIARMIS